MNKLDNYIIKNGKIADGTGKPIFTGDIRVEGEKIVEIGNIDCAGVSTIDATGCIVSPGFIELHTHYDPHIFWDNYLTPAAEHGVTTVVTGNCSISLAPIKKGKDEKITKMFKRIEDIDNDVFSKSVPYSWTHFSEYLKHFKNNIGINVGSLVGHTTLRHFVMDTDAQEREATNSEIDQMCMELADAVKNGAIGLSMSFDHIQDERSVSVASSWASMSERLELAKTLVANGRNLIQCSINPIDSGKRIAQIQELAEISKQTKAAFLILGIMENPITGDAWKKEIELLETFNKDGSNLYFETQVRPLDLNFQLSKNWIVSFYMPTWAEYMRLPIEKRIRLFADMSLRGPLNNEAEMFSSILDRVSVKETIFSENSKYNGKYLDEIAKEQGKSIIDTMLDISVSENLETIFCWKDVIHANKEIVSEMLLNRCTKIAGSDAGAHITQFSGEGDSTYLIEKFVRDHKYIRLEEGIRLLTDDIAQAFNIHKRGRLEVGYYADIVLFNLNELKRGDEQYIYDVPGQGGRYYRSSSGIRKVIVNGRIVLDEYKYTKIMPGQFA